MSAAQPAHGQRRSPLSALESMPAALSVLMSRSLRAPGVAALATTSATHHAALRGELTMLKVHDLWARRMKEARELTGDWDRVNTADAACLYLVGDTSGALAMLDAHIQRRHRAPYDINEAFALRARIRLDQGNYAGAITDSRRALENLHDGWDESGMRGKMWHIERQANYFVHGDSALAGGFTLGVLAQTLDAYHRRDDEAMANLLGQLAAKPYPAGEDLAEMALLQALMGKPAESGRALDQALNAPGGTMAIAHILASVHLRLAPVDVPWLEKFRQLQSQARSIPTSYWRDPKCFPEWEPPF